ncbi:MAG: DNA polymerase Y family protein, partial [Acidimicrobiales bacterium]
MVVWYPDWPVVASGVAGPVVVIHANRVVVASAEARSEGVRVGQRRRQAEAVCSGLAIVGRDEDRDARAFEPLVAAAARFCPTVEVMRPGLCAFSARAPARYFGGEESLARQVAEAVDAATAAGTRGEGCRVGVADGPFAGTLAARRGRIVPPGATAGFLAPLSVKELGRPELADLLGRLGVRTLGQLAALPAPQVLSRFGWEGAAVHRLARGLDERPLDARRPPEDLSVEDELDPPVERVDTAAFVAKALADRLYAGLVKGGWRCTLMRIEAE